MLGQCGSCRSSSCFLVDKMLAEALQIALRRAGDVRGVVPEILQRVSQFRGEQRDHGPAEVRAVGHPDQEAYDQDASDGCKKWKLRDTVIAPMLWAQIFVAMRCLGTRWFGLAPMRRRVIGT